MSIDNTGMNCKLKEEKVTILISQNHPLIQLSNSLNWSEIEDIVLPDLKSSTAKLKWWLGRPLRLRIHLGAYLLQQLFNQTDRQTEYNIKDNAAHQLFCGKGLVKKWHCPDHTKIEEFRSRLSPDTQCKLANMISMQAVQLGFADPKHIDIDSTIQEANMMYPNDSTLLCKLGYMCKKVSEYLNKNIYVFKHKPMEVNIKRIRSFARQYWFLSKKTDPEEKKKVFEKLYNCVYEEVELIVDNVRCITTNMLENIPWNINKIFCQIRDLAKKYLSDVKYFIENGSMIPDKILSFHLNQVKCFTKEKPGKKYQFGRVFQLARVKGNFLFASKFDEVDVSDKHAIEPMLQTHKVLFGNDNLESVTADKAYYSKNNEKILNKAGVKDICLQRPANVKSEPISSLPKYKEEILVNRRSGIEPLIGHAKNSGQLGRSRMKSDRTIESSGFASILSFNLKQLIRYKMGKIILEPT
ncbi:MAG: transposase [Legionellales bacterium]|nr:transposase [Legionellales bacterium]